MEWNTVYQGDNKETILKCIDEGLTFNLILTDPPYNKDLGNSADKQTLKKNLSDLDERFSLLQKICAPRCTILCFCTHLYVGHMQMLLMDYFQLRRLMIWRYENGMSRQLKEPVTEYKPFWWFSTSDNFVYNIDDVRVPYKSDRVKYPVYKINKSGEKRGWTPHPLGRKRGDVWEYPTLSGRIYEDEKTEHPNQKPEALFTDLIRAFGHKDTDGNLDARIFDPYLGSGTTAVCCERLNKEGHNIQWVGCELEDNWINIANNRIEKVRESYIERDIL